MFKNRFLKKLSIGIASLAVVCPLTLGATQSVNAKTHKPTTDLAISGKAAKRQKLIARKHLVRYGKNNRGNRYYAAPIAKVENQMFYDQRALNTKTGKRYVRIYRNLLKNERLDKKMLARMNKRSNRKGTHFVVPFKFVKNGKYVNHDKLSGSAYVEVAPKAGIRAKYMKIDQPASSEKVAKTKLLKQGTKLHVQVSGSSFAWVLSNKNLKSNYKPGRNVNYLWVY